MHLLTVIQYWYILCNHQGFVDYQGKNVHVESISGPDSTCIVSGVKFINNEGRGAVLKGFSVTVPAWGDYYSLRIDSASPSVIENHFIDHYNACVSPQFEDAQNGWIVGITNSSALLQGNTFSNNYMYWDSYYTSGDYSICRGMCVYVDNLGSSECVEMRNNTFHNNTAHTYGVYFYGLCVYILGESVIDNNLFYHNGFTTTNNFWWCNGNALCVDEGSSVDVTNCTFVHNYFDPDPDYVTALAVSDSTTCNVSCSIIWENTIYDPYDQISVEFSDVENGWLGTGNIDVDPFFLSGLLSDYHLDTDMSLCIDAGNPATAFNDPEDPDNPGYALWPALGSLRNDMGVYGGPGAIYWNESGTGIENTTSAIQGELPDFLGVFPNPTFNPPVVSFIVAVPSEIEILIFDVSGRLRDSDRKEYYPGYQQEVLSFLSPGIYFCRMISGDLTATQRFVVIE